MVNVLSFLKLRQEEIQIHADFVYENLKIVPTIESSNVNSDNEFIKSLLSIYDELPRPLQFARGNFEESITEKPRHNNIFGYILRESDFADDFEDLCQKVFQYDKHIHSGYAKGPYFTDKKYHSGEPMEACKKLVDRVVKWKQAKKNETGLKWDIGKDGRVYNEGQKPSTRYPDFKDWMDFNYEIRKCPITKVAFYRDRWGEWNPIENIIEAIQSQVEDAKLHHSSVRRNLGRYIDELDYKLLIDLPSWDGHDHIADMFRSLHITNLDHFSALELFKEWCGNVWARFYDCNNQNFFLILKGSQGIGKDSWVKHITRSFEAYSFKVKI